MLKTQSRETEPEFRDTEAVSESQEEPKHLTCEPELQITALHVQGYGSVTSQEAHVSTSGTDYGWMCSNFMETSFCRHSHLSCTVDHGILVPQKQGAHEWNTAYIFFGKGRHRETLLVLLTLAL